MGDLPHFQRGQIVGAYLGGSSVTKTATLLAGSRAAISKVTKSIHKSQEGIIS